MYGGRASKAGQPGRKKDRILHGSSQYVSETLHPLCIHAYFPHFCSHCLMKLMMGRLKAKANGGGVEMLGICRFADMF